MQDSKTPEDQEEYVFQQDKGTVRGHSFTPLPQSLLRDTDEQVQASPDQGLRKPPSEGTTDGQRLGQRER